MTGLMHLAIWVLCLTGIFLSLFSLSGTWLVVGAAILAVFLPGANAPGIWTVLAFLVLALVMEALEWVAGAWGVYKRGGPASVP